MVTAIYDWSTNLKAVEVGALVGHLTTEIY